MQNIKESSDAMAEEQFPLRVLIDEPAFGAERVSFKAGEEILSVDTPAKHLFLIDRGQIRTYQRGPTELTRLLDVLGANDWFGVAVLAGAGTYGLRAVAFSPSVVWKIGVDRLVSGFEAKPHLLAVINRDLARCLVKTREEASRMIFEDCNQRLISALIRLSDSAASTQREDGVVLHMTHSELAEAVGSARETVSLGLTQLRNRNLLRTGRSQLFFKPEELRRFRLQSIKSSGVLERSIN